MEGERERDGKEGTRMEGEREIDIDRQREREGAREAREREI